MRSKAAPIKLAQVEGLTGKVIEEGRAKVAETIKPKEKAAE